MRNILLTPAILLAAAAAFAPLQSQAADIEPVKTEQVRARLAKLSPAEKQELAQTAVKIAADVQNTVEERTVALRTLGLLQETGSIKALGELLADAAVGDEARIALQRVPGQATADALVAGLKTSPNAKFKIGIIESLGTLRARSAVGVLLPLLKDVQLTEAAQRALAAIATPEAFTALGRAPDSELKRDLQLDAAARILACPGCKTGSTAVLETLKEISQKTDDADAAFSAFLLRFRYQDADVAASVKSSNAVEKRAAIAFLSSSRDIESGKVLTKLLTDTKGADIVPILGAVLNRKQNSVAPELRTRVGSESDTAIKAELIKALGQLGGAGDVPFFAALLTDKEKAVADAARDALNQVRGVGVTKAFTDLIADAKAGKEVRKGLLAITIRRPLGGDAVAGLIPVLGDADEDIRMETLKAVRRIATKAQLGDLQKVTSSDERVTSGIAETVAKLKK